MNETLVKQPVATDAPRNVRLIGAFQLLSPLSHIAESISTTSYLVQEPILQEDGNVEEVFCYSGNAWRGHLRDLCATYMLEHLGNPRIPLDRFHLLFSGGRIGGEQVIDVAAARRLRRSVPHVALFGGGVINQILPGKLRVGNCYPLCREAIPALPTEHHAVAARVRYRQLTFEKSFSRMDDGKDDRLNQHVVESQRPLLADPRDKAEKPDGPQMRMTVELLIAGATLWTEIEALDVGMVELGCLVSGLHLFTRSPHIGGQANKGHGRVRLRYDLLDLDAGTRVPFIDVTDERCLLAPVAAAAKDAYDQILRDAYDRLLRDQQPEMLRLLGAG